MERWTRFLVIGAFAVGGTALGGQLTVGQAVPLSGLDANRAELVKWGKAVRESGASLD